MLTTNIIHAAVSFSQKMICKFENIETKEKLLNIMRHASYSNRYAKC